MPPTMTPARAAVHVNMRHMCLAASTLILDSELSGWAVGLENQQLRCINEARGLQLVVTESGSFTVWVRMRGKLQCVSLPATAELLPSVIDKPAVLQVVLQFLEACGICAGMPRSLVTPHALNA
jgi:hypothetical protein